MAYIRGDRRIMGGESSKMIGALSLQYEKVIYLRPHYAKERVS